MRFSESKSQGFMSNITAKTIRNLNKNDFVGFNSDRSFVQKSWLFTDSGRKKDNCYMFLYVPFS